MVRLIRSPIRRVLSSIREHRVRALLMGGQACVLYGAAEFSRDTDLVIVAEAVNLTRLRRALAELQAEVIAVPPSQLRHLQPGHAVHCRCQRVVRSWSTSFFHEHLVGAELVRTLR